MANFYIKQGDRWPPLEATLTDAAGTAVNITGATVLFNMAALNGTPHISAAADIISGAAGTVRYEWAAGDTDAAGTYHAEFVVTLAVTLLEVTFPSSGYLTIEVVREVPQ